MRSLAKRLLPVKATLALREVFGRRTYAIRSYSQEGEDLILLRLLHDVPAALYVDVGAHHPYRFSNTALLHERGWKGINIDALPGSMRAFERFRPSDINLEIGIGRERAQLQYHVFDEPALNTFDATLAAERRAIGWREIGTRTIECFPLAEVLEQELMKLGTRTIGLLSVDVEGLDLDVLRSNDWSRFRPGIIVVEVLSADVASILASAVTRYLQEVGYRPYAKLVSSTIFLPTD